VIVDRDRCESNALCMSAAPEVFWVDGDDVLHVLTATPGEEYRAQVEKAVRDCPMLALGLVD
jgi:ferredoxin